MRLTTVPIRLERTLNRFKTSLYSSRMSSVTTHTKAPFFGPLVKQVGTRILAWNKRFSET
jgi:hypothetical protein